MLRLYVPRYSSYPDQELAELEGLGRALFNPNNWGRDIVSRETESLVNPIKRQEDGSYKFEVYFDVHRYKPNEIKISTKDGLLTVEGSTEAKAEDGSFYASQSFKRALPIPAGVDKNKLKAKFTEEGGVLLEAPAEPPKPKEGGKVKGHQNLTITHE